MAKRNDATGEFEPGIIYELQVEVDGAWYAFYVGETTDPDRRLREHQWAAAHATESSTLVYRTIKQQFEPAGCAWRMLPVHTYGTAGPEDAEDEHIMMLLRQGTTLTNEKKGNANWMAERQQEAEDMVRRKITSYKTYRAVITQEQANARHAEWLAENHRALPSEFYEKVNASAEQRRQKELARRERAERRAAEVAAHRAKQIAEWKGNEQ